MHTMSEDPDPGDLDETRPFARVTTWRERHGLALLGAVMVGMLATVLVAQVGC